MEIHRYELQSSRALNARSSRRKFPGVLVRWQGGVSALQPWPELGQPPLERCLADLRSLDLPHPMVQQTLHQCERDGKARAEGRWLFRDLDLPESHFTWAGGEVPADFQRVKVKAGPDLTSLLDDLSKLSPTLRIRLDYNESLRSIEEALAHWKGLEPFHDRLEWIEDPMPYEKMPWTTLQDVIDVPLAVDRFAGPTPFLTIWKPAWA
ncbi:MAG: hypothetical protein AAGJ31_02835, partial [Verrucomicrobiota bacterium]